MKYNDSILQAKTKMALVTQQLEKWNVPANPVNYAVAYHYVAGNEPKLNQEIEYYLKLQDKLDEFLLDELYRQYVLGQSNFRDDILSDLAATITDTVNSTDQSSHHVNGFLTQLNNNLNGLQSANKKEISQTISTIFQAANLLKLQQEKVAETLVKTQEKTEQLKAELAEIRKEVYLDPLTGLYNRKALEQHLATWIDDDPDQGIAAIVVNIDNFKQLSHKFGPLISNVLLAKIAKKVRSYVGESGLPVRTNGDEFLLLLPRVEQSIAEEIAEKIREGVEKLRFVSSQTGVRLPKITISLGVNEFTARNNLQVFLTKTRVMLKNFQKQGSNQVLIAT